HQVVMPLSTEVWQVSPLSPWLPGWPPSACLSSLPSCSGQRAQDGFLKGLASCNGVFGRCQKVPAVDTYRYDASPLALQHLRVTLQKLSRTGRQAGPCPARPALCRALLST
uniref:Uncharacterized protein n=1 Tax=Urocitellus parryii TaxID=9999 RepID=A0A8D2GJ66_UROPR